MTSGKCTHLFFFTKVWLCFTLTVVFNTVYAQQKEQLWLDGQIEYPFGINYLVELAGSYQTVFNNENKWRNFSLAPTFEYYSIDFVDFVFNLPIMYTLQVDTINTMELDPAIGARFHFSQNKRINTRLLAKYEYRIFRQIDEDDWNTSNRVRLRAEAWICINGRSLYVDKLWYAIIDYEEFIVVDQQLDERYANRRRGRIGLGYRLNYKNRFEFIYSRQSSRNEIDTGFLEDDNIIQLRYKMFLTPSK